MAQIRIAGIMRAGDYSPNHIGNDAAIFNGVAEQLRRRGCEVELMSEEEFKKRTPDQPIIINMCREKDSVKKLQELEDTGRIVINSGYGIENCTRERMTLIMAGNSLPTPDSLIVNTNEKVMDDLTEKKIGACWVKRGDYHSKHKEDVTYCRHPEEAQEVLHEFFYRGIKRAVINRHLVGDLIKFYGVVGTPFFHWLYTRDEPVMTSSGNPNSPIVAKIPFDPKTLEEICIRTAETLDVKIFGGDCIIEPDGQIRIIDFNDWPSFAPCRKEASVHIAKAIINAANEKMRGIKK